MVFSLAPSVFAAEVGQIFTVTFDNKIPYAGDTITATIYMVQAPTDYYKVTSYIEYNKDILTYVSHDRTILCVGIGAAVVIAAGAICIIVRKRRKA